MPILKIACAFGEESALVSEMLATNLSPEIVAGFQKKVGTKILYRASPETDVVDLAQRALDIGIANEWDLSDVSTLIFVSGNQRYTFPGNGHVLSANFDLFENSLILSMNSGCTGFVDALAVAAAIGGKSVLICSETYSRNILKFHRSISPIFSDAASAVLINFNEITFRLLYVENKTKDFKAISCEPGEAMHMEGASVYQFLLAKVIPALEDVLSTEEFTEVFVHQGSGLVLSTLEQVFSRYRIRLLSNLQERGNTVCVTLPLLMYDCLGPNVAFGKGQKMLLVSFGVGLSVSIGTLS